MRIGFILGWYTAIITVTLTLCYYSLYPIIAIADKIVTRAERIYDEYEKNNRD